MAECRIAIIGFGKIAHTQHVPAILANPSFRLVAAVSPRDTVDLGIPLFTTLTALLAERDLSLDAVAICTPPDARHDIAVQCLDAGLHLLLEKPVASSLGRPPTSPDAAILPRKQRLPLGMHGISPR